jgi:aminoglycoside 6'-N-acetyltransferase I
MIRIVPFDRLDNAQREQAAAILIRALDHVPGAWKTMKEAHEEIDLRRNSADWTGLAAMDGQTVAGWIGGIGGGHPHAWELHPIVVAPEFQRRGIGTRLVHGLEDAARAKGILTLYAGSDDDFGGTNIFAVDVRADIPKFIRDLAATGRHPLEFYRKLGFVVVGLIPDANGIGKHDIFLAKRVI